MSRSKRLKQERTEAWDQIEQREKARLNPRFVVLHECRTHGFSHPFSDVMLLDGKAGCRAACGYT